MHIQLSGKILVLMVFAGHHPDPDLQDLTSAVAQILNILFNLFNVGVKLHALQFQFCILYLRPNTMMI